MNVKGVLVAVTLVISGYIAGLVTDKIEYVDGHHWVESLNGEEYPYNICSVDIGTLLWKLPGEKVFVLARGGERRTVECPRQTVFCRYDLR